MSYFRRYERSLTTTTGGTKTTYLRRPGATATAGDHVNGAVWEVYYIPATSTGSRFASTADITWSLERNNQAVFTLTDTTATAAVFRAPRQAAYGATGAALSRTETQVAVAQDRIKVSVAQGGASKTGTVGIIIGGA